MCASRPEEAKTFRSNPSQAAVSAVYTPHFLFQSPGEKKKKSLCMGLSVIEGMRCQILLSLYMLHHVYTVCQILLSLYMLHHVSTVWTLTCLPVSGPATLSGVGRRRGVV